MADEHALILTWEQLSVTLPGPAGPLYRRTVEEAMKQRYPGIDERWLERLYWINVANCENYVKNSLMKYHGYSLVKSEHFLMVESQPLTFCFEVIQDTIARIGDQIQRGDYLPPFYTTPLPELPTLDRTARTSLGSDHLQPLIQGPHSQFSTISTSAVTPGSGLDTIASHQLSSATRPLGAPSLLTAPEMSSASLLPSSLSTSTSATGFTARNSSTTLAGPPLRRQMLTGLSPSVVSGTASGPSSNTSPPSTLLGSELMLSSSSFPSSTNSSASSSSSNAIPFSPDTLASTIASMTLGPQLSSGHRCKKEVHGNYCRDWNLKFLSSCPDTHLYRPGIHHRVESKGKHTLTELDKDEGAYHAVETSFKGAWKLPGKTPVITKIERIHCPKLEEYYQTSMNLLEMKGFGLTRTLYHGTCEANFEILFEHGLQPPSDYEVSPNCKSCGHLFGKIATSTCLKNCPHCAGDAAKRHQWNQCHMFGLGIYFADQTSKSDQYISDIKGNKSAVTGRKMLVVEVLLGDCHQVSQLKEKHEYHDFVTAPNGKDSIMAVGLGYKSSTGLSVINNECAQSFEISLSND